MEEENPIEIESLINELLISLCECENCNDCDNDDNSNCTVYIKYGLYMSLTSTDYSSTIIILNQQFNTLLTNEANCLIENEKYYNNLDTVSSSKLLLSLYYLTLYFNEYNSMLTEQEITDLNTKFKFEEILKCIQKMNIDIENIKTLF